MLAKLISLLCFFVVFFFFFFFVFVLFLCVCGGGGGGGVSECVKIYSERKGRKTDAAWHDK